MSKILLEILRMLVMATIVCPKCDGILSYNCTYKRNVIETDGKSYEVHIIQSYCVKCDVHQSLIPDFIMPHKHYSADVIEATIEQALESVSVSNIDCPADESTIRRWFAQFNERAAKAAGEFVCILMEFYRRAVSVLRMYNLSLLHQLSLLLSELEAPASDRIIGRANALLTRSGLGFI